MLRKRSDDLYEENEEGDENLSEIWDREIWEKLEEVSYEFKNLVRENDLNSFRGIRSFGSRLSELVEEAQIISSSLEK